MTEVMEPTRKARIEREVARMADEIASLDEEFIGDVIGIAQASGQLRKALDKLNSLIDARKYEEAANLGYSDIASEFIFLQRCLGALNDTCNSKSALVSQVIIDIGSELDMLAYEEVDPFVTEKMKSLQPKEPSQ